jgi:cell division control protein 6
MMVILQYNSSYTIYHGSIYTNKATPRSKLQTEVGWYDMQTTLREIFLKQHDNSIFLNRSMLQSNFIPSKIPYREEQAQALAKILAPAVQGEKPSNVMVYGPPGTGKTLVAKVVMKELQEVAKTTGVPLQTVYVNARLRRMADTEYRLVAQLARLFGCEVPFTGLPLNEVYSIFFNAIDKPGVIIIFLDEIDHLLKKSGAEVLFNLTSGATRAQICFVGISNNLNAFDNTDPRIRSRLSPEELFFPPYNAMQLQEILELRSAAFRPGTLDPAILPKCAAYAAREHGDSRRAIELLRISSELAERNTSTKIIPEYVERAKDKLELDRVLDVLRTQPIQCKLVLYAISQGATTSGEVYEKYQAISQSNSIPQLTQRRVADLVEEMALLGLVNSKLISKGRYGRTREISLSVRQEAKTGLDKYLKAEFG